MDRAEEDLGSAASAFISVCRSLSGGRLTIEAAANDVSDKIAEVVQSWQSFRNSGRCGDLITNLNALTDSASEAVKALESAKLPAQDLCTALGVLTIRVNDMTRLVPHSQRGSTSPSQPPKSSTGRSSTHTSPSHPHRVPSSPPGGPDAAGHRTTHAAAAGSSRRAQPSTTAAAAEPAPAEPTESAYLGDGHLLRAANVARAAMRGSLDLASSATPPSAAVPIAAPRGALVSSDTDTATTAVAAGAGGGAGGGGGRDELSSSSSSAAAQQRITPLRSSVRSSNDSAASTLSPGRAFLTGRAPEPSSPDVPRSGGHSTPIGSPVSHARSSLSLSMPDLPQQVDSRGDHEVRGSGSDRVPRKKAAPPLSSSGAGNQQQQQQAQPVPGAASTTPPRTRPRSGSRGSGSGSSSSLGGGSNRRQHQQQQPAVQPPPPPDPMPDDTYKSEVYYVGDITRDAAEITLGSYHDDVFLVRASSKPYHVAISAHRPRNAVDARRRPGSSGSGSSRSLKEHEPKPEFMHFLVEPVEGRWKFVESEDTRLYETIQQLLRESPVSMAFRPIRAVNRRAGSDLGHDEHDYPSSSSDAPAAAADSAAAPAVQPTAGAKRSLLQASTVWSAPPADALRSSSGRALLDRVNRADDDGDAVGGELTYGDDDAAPDEALDEEYASLLSGGAGVPSSLGVSESADLTATSRPFSLVRPSGPRTASRSSHAPPPPLARSSPGSSPSRRLSDAAVPSASAVGAGALRGSPRRSSTPALGLDPSGRVSPTPKAGGGREASAAGDEPPSDAPAAGDDGGVFVLNSDEDDDSPPRQSYAADEPAAVVSSAAVDRSWRTGRRSPAPPAGADTGAAPGSSGGGGEPSVAAASATAARAASFSSAAFDFRGRRVPTPPPGTDLPSSAASAASSSSSSASAAVASDSAAGAQRQSSTSPPLQPQPHRSSATAPAAALHFSGHTAAPGSPLDLPSAAAASLTTHSPEGSVPAPTLPSTQLLSATGGGSASSGANLRASAHSPVGSALRGSGDSAAPAGGGSPPPSNSSGTRRDVLGELLGASSVAVVQSILEALSLAELDATRRQLVQRRDLRGDRACTPLIRHVDDVVDRRRADVRELLLASELNQALRIEQKRIVERRISEVNAQIAAQLERQRTAVQRQDAEAAREATCLIALKQQELEAQSAIFRSLA